jgi:uncharacterized protein (DUF1501 family)
MTHLSLHSRRGLLRMGVTMGDTMGVTFLVAPAALAANAPTSRKLIVIVCRGALDGLSVSPPLNDPNYLALRGSIAIPAAEALKLDRDFGLHPKLTTVYGLAQAGQARIAPAVAIPERIRSHFEAQDLLETGGGHLYAATTGWLNRALAAQTHTQSITALSVGAQEPLILRGTKQIQSWSPEATAAPDTSRIAAVLQDLYKSDSLLGPAFASGLQTEMTAEQLDKDGPAGGHGVRKLAETAAKFLVADHGPSILVLSLEGFDTHANQGASDGLLAKRLETLDEAFNGLHSGMGTKWSDTVVIAVTEFGRTARINGTAGTDHGTASTMILAGGALKPGGIVGDWPTLADAKLFENRDLAPTLDVRQVFKGVLSDHMGIEDAALDTVVFPDSRDAKPLRGLVA